MSATTLISVELTPYEMRALKNAASLLEGALVPLEPLAEEFRPAGHTIHPLQSAQLKLELALLLEGEEH